MDAPAVRGACLLSTCLANGAHKKINCIELISSNSVCEFMRRGRDPKIELMCVVMLSAGNYVYFGWTIFKPVLSSSSTTGPSQPQFVSNNNKKRNVASTIRQRN